MGQEEWILNGNPHEVENLTIRFQLLFRLTTPNKQLTINKFVHALWTFVLSGKNFTTESKKELQKKHKDFFAQIRKGAKKKTTEY